MGRIEEILIICGISLETFAFMECQGALVARIEKKLMFVMCGLTSLWQLSALYLGNLLSALLCRRGNGGRELPTGQAIAVLIFICMGIRLLIKAVKNEHIVEHREENPEMRRIFGMSAVTSPYTFFAGAAFGFLGTDIPLLLLMIALITAAVVVLGMYTGYRLGFEHKLKAYIAGGLMLVTAGVDIFLRNIRI